MSRTTIWAGRIFVVVGFLSVGMPSLQTATGIDLNTLGTVMTGATNVAVVVFLVLVMSDLVRWVARRRRIARDQAR